MTVKTKTGSKRGFASMDPEKHRKIAKMGGKKAHKLGVAHTWTSEEASIAGLKGAKMKRLKREGLFVG